ncbi:DUF2807 domain-containing protein [Variovorax sp. PCZ-1]|uniref:GIN domain-containing protein n=1 Tax=Variovorax sp. PCZ-1 TaxID=2835533 RepID=UPI001BCCE2C4|nr:DUF2807 domain-containing protein [Variovorax sp. PCZ-1]MBS7807648.1 DUF2807 domain-containing protein [Variovorax sp. PCZ-1]
MTYAQTLHLASCEHAVILRYGTTDAPKLSAAAEALGVSLHSQSNGVSMQCKSPQKKHSLSAASSSSVVIINGTRINRAFGTGAVAEQNIGGRSNKESGSKADSQVVVTVPSGWRIQARNWVGSLSTHAGIWQADVEISAGEMSFTQLKDSRLVIDAGDIKAQSLLGRLDASMRGAGSIEVERANDAVLNLQLNGAGSMTFKGRAQSAQIRASGVGSIEIEKLVNEPFIQASSLATIDIGR